MRKYIGEMFIAQGPLFIQSSLLVPIRTAMKLSSSSSSSLMFGAVVVGVVDAVADVGIVGVGGVVGGVVGDVVVVIDDVVSVKPSPIVSSLHLDWLWLIQSSSLLLLLMAGFMGPHCAACKQPSSSPQTVLKLLTTPSDRFQVEACPWKASPSCCLSFRLGHWGHFKHDISCVELMMMVILWWW